MERNNKAQEDLMAIRDMMERSSKYLSLSGLSGIFAGSIAIIGSAFAYFEILEGGNIRYDEYMQSIGNASTQAIRINLIITALLILITAFTGAIFFSARKAKRKKLKFWNKTSKQMLIHLFIPLITGGIFTIMMIYQNNISMVAPTTLLFYGIALVSAGKFTFGEIHYLGLSEIILGLLSGFFVDYGFLLWTIGFGLLHIVYGIVMYYKYER